ncbi:D-alanyl-D-alanine carboxypeptidase family protein, partial [Camelimonas abortus]
AAALAAALGGAASGGAALAAGPLAAATAAPQPGAGATASEFRTAATSLIVIDADSGSVLLEKAADAPVAPAGMTKIMTALLAFEALAEGRISPEDRIRISEHAWRTGGGPSGGPAMFAALGSEVRVADLLRGMLVQTGNDAAIALAEGIAGGEPAFVARMNAKARALGLTRTVFANASGLPHPDQTTSARDMARLSMHLIRSFPEQYRIFSEPEFTWNRILQRNRNPLLRAVEGADGLQPGHTHDGGFSIAGSATHDGRRLVFVAAGYRTAAERVSEAKRLVEWVARAFEPRHLFRAGDTVAEARVFGGASRTAPLRTKQAVSVMARRGGDERLTARVVYRGPLPAPTREGDEAGVLQVLRGDQIALEAPLHVGAAVAKGNLAQRARDGALELAGRWIRKALRRE